jgi:hypothetical protein
VKGVGHPLRVILRHRVTCGKRTWTGHRARARQGPLRLNPRPALCATASAWASGRGASLLKQVRRPAAHRTRGCARAALFLAVALCSIRRSRSNLLFPGRPASRYRRPSRRAERGSRGSSGAALDRREHGGTFRPERTERQHAICPSLARWASPPPTADPTERKTEQQHCAEPRGHGWRRVEEPRMGAQGEFWNRIGRRRAS